MKMHVMLCVVAVVLGQLWCHRALADDSVPALDLTADSITAVTNQAGKAMGWEFTLAADITVTHLGVFDDGFTTGLPGFLSGYDIGIFRKSDGVLLASAALSAGTPGLYVSPYGYAELTTPVTLAAFDGPESPVHYVIAFWTPEGSGDLHIRWITPDTEPANALVSPVVNDRGYGLTSLGYPGKLVMPTEQSEDDLFTATFMFTLTPPEPTPITIDIKPGSYPNCINLGSNGVVPVAILSTAAFDATTVDPATAYLAGAGVAVRGKGNKYLSHCEDVNGDGLVDLVVQVETENLDPGTFQDGYAVLVALTNDGEELEGWDEITIVPR